MDSIETIRNRMLSVIPSYLDKSEGSFIWDLISSTSIEIYRNGSALAEELKETFVEEAIGDNLDKRTSEKGIYRLLATNATGEVELTGTPGTIIPSGSIVSTENGVQFKTNNQGTIESTGNVIIPVIAIESGVSGNVPANIIKFLPITISGVKSVTNLEPTLGGRNTETDEALRYRYFDNINNQAIDGNASQYKKWAQEYPGVGKSKVFALWNGPNTIKISILDAENKIASQGLIQEFQSYIDPDSEGLGNGIAPIGSIVTVSTASPVTINITANIVLTEGYTEATDIDETLTTYLSEIAYSKNTVSYMGVGAIILGVPSIDQVQNLLINGEVVDIILTQEQIPVLGSTDWTVI